MCSMASSPDGTSARHLFVFVPPLTSWVINRSYVQQGLPLEATIVVQPSGPQYLQHFDVESEPLTLEQEQAPAWVSYCLSSVYYEDQGTLSLPYKVESVGFPGGWFAKNTRALAGWY
ncbi:hypothetical protein DL546_006788 [Coniochaeta pulveracea]|uniref:Uncharacterized protein n=1 Tax=Coniochaeta pulveracea TaxID=177199 RepID=A0A420YL15_9PEZI|nr:hypothetical protein DL546_006788 [Coniochaeta pulveracea]